jgi:TolA-binding protein
MSNLVESDVIETSIESVAVASEMPNPLCTDADGATESEGSPEKDPELLARLLAVAQRHRKTGNIQNAEQLLWALIEEHAGTPEADAAKAELAGLFEGFARAAAGQTALERLLVMAQRYRKEGNLREAMELFWTLVQDHPKTLQAASAKSELLALAESYERAGNQHIARGMYERLLDLED